MGLPVKELLNIGKVQLEQSGVIDAKRDAKTLYCHMKAMTEKDFLMSWQYEAMDDDCEKFFQLIEIRAAGTPTQYITGIQSFMGHEFDVNESVLIPRQDTETMVEDVIELLEKGTIRGEEYAQKSNWDVLDLCTGSGAIGISLYKEAKNLGKIVCSDVSQDAIKVAKGNRAKLGAERVDIIVSNLFESFKGKLRNKRFDLIVSNPPYIRSDVIPTLQREVKDHEPMMALDGGEDGLDFYRKIVEEAPGFLKKEGILVLEIGHDQGQALQDMLNETGKFEEVKCLKDLARRDRIIVAKLINSKKH